MIEPKDMQRRSQFHLIDALKGTGVEIRNPKSFRCPFHDDTNASAGVYEDEEGVWRFKCLATSCGLNLDVYDVIEKTTGETVESQLSAIRESHRPKVERARKFDSLEHWKAKYLNITAVWGTGEVRRYSPDGEVVAVVAVPAPHTSSVAFVGPGRDLLLITTAQSELTEGQLAEFPDSGRLFLADPGVAGLPTTAWHPIPPQFGPPR